MAFKIENITPIANNAKRGVKPVLWMFWNEDDDTITADGYFSEIINISNGDQILVVNKNKDNMSNYHITIDSSNVVKAVANSTSTPSTPGQNGDS